jgi:ketosteroid isomerase-like protein
MGERAELDQQGLASVVTGFYRALWHGDAEAAAQLVNDHFAADAELIRPGSLPGGGTLRGVRAIVAFVRAAVSSGAAIELDRVLASTVGEQTDVIAALSLNLGHAAMPVLERWTFVGDRASRLQAFYFDTAAMVAAAKT